MGCRELRFQVISEAPSQGQRERRGQPEEMLANWSAEAGRAADRKFLAQHLGKAWNANGRQPETQVKHGTA
jgi:hypothetical protein